MTDGEEWLAFGWVVAFVGALSLWGYLVQRRESRLADDARTDLYRRRRRNAWWRVPLTMLGGAGGGVLAVTASHDEPFYPGVLVIGGLAGLAVGLIVVSIFYPQRGR